MRLSYFEDEKAIQVVAKLLVPIGNIVKNRENVEAKGKSVIEFASAILQNSASDVMTMFAILNDVPTEEYHCNAATVLQDVLSMLNDPALLQLFGLQRQTAASSPSASTTGEAEEA